MDNFTAIGIAEGFEPCESEEQYLDAWQHLVNTGLAWSLQGWFGSKKPMYYELKLDLAMDNLLTMVGKRIYA